MFLRIVMELLDFISIVGGYHLAYPLDVIYKPHCFIYIYIYYIILSFDFEMISMYCLFLEYLVLCDASYFERNMGILFI